MIPNSLYPDNLELWAGLASWFDKLDRGYPPSIPQSIPIRKFDYLRFLHFSVNWAQLMTFHYPAPNLFRLLPWVQQFRIHNPVTRFCQLANSITSQNLLLQHKITGQLFANGLLLESGHMYCVQVALAPAYYSLMTSQDVKRLGFFPYHFQRILSNASRL